MNEIDIRRTYQFLKHKRNTEVRLIDPWGMKPPLSYHASDIESFLEICRRFNGQYNVYVGMNERHGHGTKSGDVCAVNATVFDVDSLHPRGRPANDAEVAGAQEVANKIFDYFDRKGKKPALAMSGNGWQIWVPLSIEITDENRYKVEGVLKDMQRTVINTFSKGRAKVDNIGDLARVIKVIGTRSLKPYPTIARPNRTSYWCIHPDALALNEQFSERLLRMSQSYVPEVPIVAGSYSDEDMPEAQVGMHKSGMGHSTRTLFDGDWEGRYASRSEAEFALLMKMATQGFTKEEAWQLMPHCGIGKWRTENHTYRTKTLERAYRWALE